MWGALPSPLLYFHLTAMQLRSDIAAAAARPASVWRSEQQQLRAEPSSPLGSLRSARGLPLLPPLHLPRASSPRNLSIEWAGSVDLVLAGHNEGRNGGILESAAELQAPAGAMAKQLHKRPAVDELPPLPLHPAKELWPTASAVVPPVVAA